jgi:NAD(P)-dependent dehydrogenase (short-subunit alcohol dehydrogenase family)
MPDRLLNEAALLPAPCYLDERTSSTMELQDQRALVTGATSGIGREAAKLLAREGALVIVSGRNSDRGAETVAAIEADGGKARFIAADLGDMDSVQNLAGEVGDIDILVNNAGVFPFASTIDQDVASFEDMFATNVHGPFFLTAALVPKMVAKGAGSIINISTMGATIALPNAAAYSATKAALDSLTRTWAAEFSGSGVRVNSIAPGPTRTNAVLSVLGDDVERQGSETLLRRTAEPEEIAQVIVFLASSRSSYITGATLAVDGGRSVA